MHVLVNTKQKLFADPCTSVSISHIQCFECWQRSEHVTSEYDCFSEISVLYSQYDFEYASLRSLKSLRI